MLRNNVRPQFDDRCPESFKKLVNDCWQTEAEDRPDFDEIVSVLLPLYAEHTQNQYHSGTDTE